MKNRQQNGSNVSFGILSRIILLTILTVSLKVFEDKPLAASQDRQASQKAFVEACNVFFHPRCINCHPAGDAPMISDTSLPHRFNVKRGPDGKGTAGMSCTLCHRDKNQPDGPPGVPNWHMPTESMPMIFQGKTPAELCRQLKDPKQNGGKTGHQIIEHLDADPLVLWGWNPGKGRTSPPMDHKIFTSKMREWITLGAHCPE
jgi:hypothetical protein